MIFFDEKLRDFFFRACAIFVRRGCVIFFVERLRDFSHSLKSLPVKRLRDLCVEVP